jgi:putative transposase
MENLHEIYNEIRPHSAIGNKAPISLLNGSSAPRRHEPNPGKFQFKLA